MGSDGIVCDPSSEPRFDEGSGWTISISSRRAINVNEVGMENGLKRAVSGPSVGEHS